jgi:hypothetical protein
MASYQFNKLFAPRNEEWVWYYDESPDAILSHGRKSRFKLAFSAGGQHVRALLVAFAARADGRSVA